MNWEHAVLGGLVGGAIGIAIKYQMGKGKDSKNKEVSVHQSPPPVGSAGMAANLGDRLAAGAIATVGTLAVAAVIAMGNPPAGVLAALGFTFLSDYIKDGPKSFLRLKLVRADTGADVPPVVRGVRAAAAFAFRWLTLGGWLVDLLVIAVRGDGRNLVDLVFNTRVVKLPK